MSELQQALAAARASFRLLFGEVPRPRMGGGMSLGCTGERPEMSDNSVGGGGADAGGVRLAGC
jgi:hypothetical protein